MSACLLLGLGATGCTKKNKETTTKTKTDEKTTTTDKGTKTVKTEEKKTETKELTLAAPGDQTIKQGGTAKVKVSITRENLTDPVELKLTDLPDGVKVDGTPTIAKDANSTEVMLKADDTAKEVKNHTVKVWATSGTLKHDATFKLTVTKK